MGRDEQGIQLFKRNMSKKSETSYTELKTMNKV